MKFVVEFKQGWFCPCFRGNPSRIVRNHRHRRCRLEATPKAFPESSSPLSHCFETRYHTTLCFKTRLGADHFLDGFLTGVRAKQLASRGGLICSACSRLVASKAKVDWKTRPPDVLHATCAKLLRRVAWTRKGIVEDGASDLRVAQRWAEEDYLKNAGYIARNVGYAEVCVEIAQELDCILTLPVPQIIPALVQLCDAMLEKEIDLRVMGPPYPAINSYLGGRGVGYHNLMHWVMKLCP